MPTKKDWTRKVEVTADGSSTFFIPEWDERYHSKHGAIQEGLHVFIKMGLETMAHRDKLNILEMGLGTGLNFLLTLKHLPKDQQIHYTSLEAFPLNVAEWKAIKSPFPELNKAYEELHEAKWGVDQQVDLLTLLKLETNLEDYAPAPNQFDIIYFDAFGPRVQPELWSLAVFQKLYLACADGGFLVTYCAQGQVRRNMIAAGFEVEKLQGPPGKREMLRARKNGGSQV